MQIERNKSGTYSLFLPMGHERLGKYGFRVRCMGSIADGDFETAMTGLVDERHRRQFTVSAGAMTRGRKWAR